MHHTTRLICPYCKSENPNQLVVDSFSDEYHDTWECSGCEQPFYYTWEANVTVGTFRIEGFKDVKQKAASR